MRCFKHDWVTINTENINLLDKIYAPGVVGWGLGCLLTLCAVGLHFDGYFGVWLPIAMAAITGGVIPSVTLFFGMVINIKIKDKACLKCGKMTFNYTRAKKRKNERYKAQARLKEEHEKLKDMVQ